jgi:tubulin-specific chaperone D
MCGVFQDFRSDDRVIIPLLKALDVFLSHSVFRDALPGEEHGLWLQSLHLKIQAEIQGCRDIKKILLCVVLLVHLLSDGDTFKPGPPLSTIMVLLGHRFPRVRKAAAEQLYIKLVECDAPEALSETYDDILEKLSTSIWDADNLGGVRGERDALCALFGLAPPERVKDTGRDSVQNKGGKENRRGETLETYAALVKDAGY